MSKNESVDITHLSTFALRSEAVEVIDIPSHSFLQSTIVQLRKANISFVVIGGGSNSLFSKFVNKTILLMKIEGIRYKLDNSETKVVVGAGVNWDDLVVDTITKGYSGLELLSAIPGSVGATPIQNIGAYGTEIAEHIYEIEVYDIELNLFKKLIPDDCNFGYRTSNFKTVWIEKYIVVAVTFLLSREINQEIKYPGVIELLPKDKNITPQIVRDTIIKIRWSKLPKPELLPNVGSFFQNPIVSHNEIKNLLFKFPNMPVFPVEGKKLNKISAGWLIEQCGWKGKAQGSVGMYEKNALVMVNYGISTIDDVLDLQKTIQQSVKEKFNIQLVREPIIIK